MWKSFKQICLSFASVVVVLGTGVPVWATDYEVCVETDAATDSDLELVAGYLDTAVDGDKPSRTMRNLVNGAVGEYTLLLDRKVTADGYLTMYDSSKVALYDGDRIEVKKCTDPTPPETITIKYGMVTAPPGDLIKDPNIICRPIEICRQAEDSKETCMQIPPVEVKYK